MTSEKSEKSNLQKIIDKAQEKIIAANILLENKLWNDAASRAYYAAFHAILAVLYQHGLHFKSHSQSLGIFKKNIIKTGIFPREWGSRLSKIFRDRDAGDYRTSSQVPELIAREDVQFAEQILKQCKEYLGIK
jgi:uncharacterized protein (UPF0332 family)